MADQRIDKIISRINAPCVSLTSLNMFIKYCLNPQNKEQLFVEFDEYSNAYGDVTGKHAVADYHIMNAVLNRLDNQGNGFIHSHSFGQVETQKFMRDNVYNFLEVCPLEYISHQHCPKDILDKMANREFSTIEVKAIEFEETINGETKKFANQSMYRNFNENEGPVIASIMNNMRDISDARNIDKTKIAHIFFVGLAFADAIRKGQSGLSENMYNSARCNGPIGEFINAKSLFKNIDLKVLKFISEHYKELTKGLTSPITLNAKKLQNKKDLVKIQKVINEVIEAKEKVMSKYQGKTELTNIISDVSRAGSKESHEATMMADLLNVPEYDLKGFVPSDEKDGEEFLREQEARAKEYEGNDIDK